MLYLYTGTDRDKARKVLNAAVAKNTHKGTIVQRISDANTIADLHAGLGGRGMFAQERIVIFEGVLASDEMRLILLDALKHMKDSGDTFYIYEEKPDAATRKQMEKYAEASERFDAAKKADKSNSIFAMANALKRGDKKALWVSYQSELANHAAPEAIHGVLFWGAKDMLLKANSEKDISRARKLVALLAELPHESRRRGYELEYALESFVLSGA